MNAPASLALGAPCASLLPVQSLAAAFSGALGARGPELLSYGASVEGHPELRATLRAWLASYLGPCAGHTMFVTHGATEALTLALRAITQPGDFIAVESPTYAWILPELRAQGLRVLPLPVDEQGLDVAQLARWLARDRGRLRCVYCMPTYQNPSGALLSEVRRGRLLELAREYDFLVLEDDPYFAFAYDETPPAPLVARSDQERVLHVGSLSKLIAPGLRLGWLLVPERAVAGVRALKHNASNPVACEAAVAYMRGPFVQDLAQKVAYLRASRDLAEAGLLPLRTEGFSWHPPRGGFYLWLRLPAASRSDAAVAWLARAGIRVLSGDAFFAAAGPPHVRICFAAVPHEQLREVVERTCESLSRWAREGRRR